MGTRHLPQWLRCRLGRHLFAAWGTYSLVCLRCSCTAHR